MQYNHGPFPQWNYGPYNAFIPPQQPCNPVPEIVGEGEVVSTMNPDGSVQFYFVPVLTYPCSFRCMTMPCVTSCGAWLIKSISNPIAASMTNQHGFASQRCLPIPIPEIQSCFMPDNNAKPSYQLKFHNDGCSSTSDLHYFCPDLRTCWWIPPVPALPPEPPEPPQHQLTFPEKERPNLERPPYECMCVDQQTNKRKHESENPISCPSTSSRLCLSTSKKKKIRDTSTAKEKSVRITSSKSSCCSLRSLLNKIKRKTKKRNDNTKHNDSSKCVISCCSHCECTRQGTKRKKENIEPSPCPSTSSGSWNWCKKKQKQNKRDTSQNPSSSKEEKDRKLVKNACTSSRFCLDLCKGKKKNQDQEEINKIPTNNKEKKPETSSSYGSSLKSLLDKIRASLSSLYCTPSNCDGKEQTSAKPVKSNKSYENKNKKSASPQSSGISLKGIFAKVCSTFEKNKGNERESTDDKPKKTPSPSLVRILYDSESKGLSRSSERSISFDTTQSPSRFENELQHCGCDKCIRCTCNQKTLDCQCSKREEIDKHKADNCTCYENKNKENAMDSRCDKVSEDLKELFCYCKGSQSKKLFCECDKDEPKTQKIQSDCKCPEHLRLFGCKCPRDSNEYPCPCGCGRDTTQCEERCKSRTRLEKKRSNLKTLKLTQSANGDKKKRGHFVCGCDVDGKDETNCDEKCKYKSSLNEVIENQRQTDCRCNNENATICECESKKVTKKETAEKIINKETKERKTDRNKCGCTYDPKKKTCDKHCKNKPKLTLRRAWPEDRPEEIVMAIEPSDSGSFLTSGSSDYCSCGPGRCKYKGTPGDSACSCDSEVE